jgi:hypothetical protein
MNENHDEKGRFSSGEVGASNRTAISEFHKALMNTNTRSVPGHKGLIPRSQVVARHANSPSVGVGGSGGGGSSGSSGDGGGGGGRPSGGEKRKKAISAQQTIHGNPGGTGSADDWAEIRHQHYKSATQ